MLISRFDTREIEDHIKKFEAEYCFDFPNQYRDFLLKYNGGYSPKTKFRINKVSSDVRGFYGFGSADINYSFFTENKEIDDYTSNKVIPIACDSFGNYIVISIDVDTCGQVYFEDHEQGNKLSLLTKDFATFVKACKSEPISEASKRSIEEREAVLIANGRKHVITDSLRANWQAEIDKYGKMNQEELIL